MNDKQVMGVVVVLISIIGLLSRCNQLFGLVHKSLNPPNQQKSHLNLFLITLLALVFTIAPSVAFAETVMDKDVFAPGAQFDSKPLDEAQQEDQDLADIWTYAIIIVIGIIIARIVLQVVKKRMSRST